MHTQNPIQEGLYRRRIIAASLVGREDVQLLRGLQFPDFARQLRTTTDITGVSLDHYVVSCMYDALNGIDIFAR